jgi:hypothetical protein
LHAGNTKEEVDRLVSAVIEWAEGEIRKEREEGEEMQRKGERRKRVGGAGMREGGTMFVASKL